MSTVFCRGCGKEINESVVYCPHCGASQSTPSAPKKGKGLKIFFIICGVAALGRVYTYSVNHEKDIIKKSACPLVTQIIHEQLEISTTCKVVKITQNLGNGLYKAEATLDNGNDIKITIERKDDNIEVTIPPQ